MDKQAIFNKVAVHLLTQKQKSIVGSECRYRGLNGMKCPIGSLIPDDLYCPGMEGNSVYYVLLLSPLLCVKLKVTRPADVKFLTALQRIHDFYPTEMWKGKLLAFAHAHQLETYMLDPNPMF